ncbi:hypothetical protein RJ639_024524 [Escallonia herrerae]|uniref:UBN2_2 domain-containing protein n=1 Tax=Escallonia herrerae TaxID=1293975 RepID=A0AA88UZ59_9ASTE|nr:hypothetical protein RJ639_024524 [Escallonia herrerae]
MACFDSAYSPAAITGYLSSIKSLSGTNFRKWKEQISIILGVMDLDYALRVDAPAALTAESSTEQKAACEKWERSNCISLMIMKGSITTAIRGAIPDSDNAKLYLAHIEEQFQDSSKAHATTLSTKMVMLKYSGSNGVREHILRMNDMASQLKGLDMGISEVDTVYVPSMTSNIISVSRLDAYGYSFKFENKGFSLFLYSRVIGSGLLE